MIFEGLLDIISIMFMENPLDVYTGIRDVFPPSFLWMSVGTHLNNVFNFFLFDPLPQPNI